MYGNRHTLPRSTANPMTARRNSTFLFHVSLPSDAEARAAALAFLHGGSASKLLSDLVSGLDTKLLLPSAGWAMLSALLPLLFPLELSIILVYLFGSIALLLKSSYVPERVNTCLIAHSISARARQEWRERTTFLLLGRCMECKETLMRKVEKQ